jgi:glutaredoxin
VEYQEIDVSKDSQAFQQIVNITHQNVVPQTDIDGTIVIGYDEAGLSQQLGIAN